jgi:hypothetical protein
VAGRSPPSTPDSWRAGCSSSVPDCG